MNTGAAVRILPRKKKTIFSDIIRPISSIGSVQSYHPTNLVLTLRFHFAPMSKYCNDPPVLTLQVLLDAKMSPALRHVGKGFERRVRSFDVYDVNGYRFRTRSYEGKRGNLKTTCSGVRTPGIMGRTITA
jgi:hypothetical protein